MRAVNTGNHGSTVAATRTLTRVPSTETSTSCAPVDDTNAAAAAPAADSAAAPSSTTSPAADGVDVERVGAGPSGLERDRVALPVRGHDAGRVDEDADAGQGERAEQHDERRDVPGAPIVGQ